MNESTDVVEQQSDLIYGRNVDQDLELWKHYANSGGEDKNRMVTMTTWLFGASAAMLWYVLTGKITPVPLGIKDPLIVLGFTMIGMCVSLLAVYISLLYGGYSNRNWMIADQIAKSRGWIDLLPSKNKNGKWKDILFSAGKDWGDKLNEIARGLAWPCEPEKQFAPVFTVFLGIAMFSLAAHLSIFSLSLATLLF